MALFIRHNTVSTYEEDNDLFASEEEKELTKYLLCSDFKIVENWFSQRYMLLNPIKYHFMCISKSVADSSYLTLMTQF